MNGDCRYYATKIPPQVGMKAGDIVKGVVKGNDANDVVTSLVAKKINIGKTFSLGELATLHQIDLEGDVLVLEKKAHYCTRLVFVDTKFYGLPQTRERKVNRQPGVVCLSALDSA